MQSSCILDHLHVALKHVWFIHAQLRDVTCRSVYAALACPKVVKLPRLAQHDEPSK